MTTSIVLAKSKTMADVIVASYCTSLVSGLSNHQEGASDGWTVVVLSEDDLPYMAKGDWPYLVKLLISRGVIIETSIKVLHFFTTVILAQISDDSYLTFRDKYGPSMVPTRIETTS